MVVEFREWPKIPRGNGESVTVTEKIDGTNACVIVDENNVVIGAQSRSQLLAHRNEANEFIITTDNFAFAYWVKNNIEELGKLGEGYHYGEWAGPGIQKNHHNLTEKSFFLFNTQRWNKDNPNKPDCCKVVKVLYEGPYNETVKENTMRDLWLSAKENNYHPEGIVLWYHKGRRYEKVTFENANGKWQS